jgi:hypothetical protein
MSKVPLQSSTSRLCDLQGYFAHKKHPRLRTLQQDYTWGHMVVLEGGLFLISEVPLYIPR